MNYFKVLLTIVFCALVFVSCSNELEEHVEPQNLRSNLKRVQFSDQESFLNSWAELSKMDKQELTNWIDENNISLSNNGYKNPNIDDVRDYFRALFNIDNELQIGDSIIWYNDGQMLLVSTNADEDEVNINKLNPSKCFVFGKIEKEILTVDEEGAITTRGSLGSSGISSSNQTEFTSTLNPSVKFKYVYELVSFKNTLANATSYELVFANKLEWKKNAGFKEASEPRICTTKLSGGVTCEVWGVGVPVNTTFNVGYNRTDELAYNQGILLGRVAHPNGSHNFKCWSFSISCNITQELKGDPGSRRSASYVM